MRTGTSTGFKDICSTISNHCLTTKLLLLFIL